MASTEKTKFAQTVSNWWSKRSKTTLFFLIVVFPASIWWWHFAGDGNRLRSTLLAGISLASFTTGCLIGFVFSSYGEELSTIGKIRDWLIGALTGITLVEASRIREVIAKFAINPTDNEFALVASMAVVYLGLGFLFMFFQRELVLNVILAKSRAERGRLDGTQETTLAIQKLLAQLPPNVLTGVEDITEVQVSTNEKTDLKNALYSGDVEMFLKQADDAMRDGTQLDWDVVSKVAHIRYYRVYFETQNRSAAIDKALEWIERALVMNPLHTDLTMKYADMLDFDDQKQSSVAVLERLALQPDAPAVVNEWLGFYLRSDPQRVDDSISYSKRFLCMFPDDSDTQFNLAYAYGVKHCQQVRTGSPPDETSDTRRRALEYLSRALTLQPGFRHRVAKWVEQKKGFECFGSDPDFQALIRPGAENKTP